jgi:hypothetical protein
MATNTQIASNVCFKVNLGIKCFVFFFFCLGDNIGLKKKPLFLFFLVKQEYSSLIIYFYPNT